MRAAAGEAPPRTPPAALSFPVVTAGVSPTTGSPFPLPWKPQLGTGDAGVVTLPVVGAHGPPGGVCEHLEHAAPTAHADWGRRAQRLVSAGGPRGGGHRLPGADPSAARSELPLARGAPTAGPRHCPDPELTGGLFFSLTGPPQASPSSTGRPSLRPDPGEAPPRPRPPRQEGPAAALAARVLPHRNSSSPSLQWGTPSHRAARSMHLKDDRHRYFPEQSKWTEGGGGGRC